MAFVSEIFSLFNYIKKIALSAIQREGIIYFFEIRPYVPWGKM